MKRFMLRATQYLSAVAFSVCALNSYAFNDTSFLNDPEHQFWFDINDVPTIKLTFSEDQWSLLLTSTQDNREEVSGNMYYYKNGEEYSLTNIGIKIGGNTSFTLPEYPGDQYVQANFTLDFDEFVDDQELSGISALKLKRFKDDSTFVHEPLSNQIMQNFGVWTAHSSTYARVEVKVGNRALAYYGLYRMNESVNRSEYLDKRFDPENDGGGLWQGNNQTFGKAHFSKINGSWGGVGDFEGASFEYKGKGKDEEDNTAVLVNFAQNVTNLEGNDFVAFVDANVNVPLLLKGLASEAVLGHWDGFWGNGNNFLIYFDESDVMHFIPYDTDNTLGTSAIVSDSGTRDPLNFGTSNNAPLFVKKIMAVEKYQAEYKTYIKTLVTQDNLMVEAYSVNWINKAHDLIDGFLGNWTNDNESINDNPASWSNQSGYRLWNFNGGRNWYTTRKDTVLNAVKAPGQVFDTVYFRGVTNSWGATLMTETSQNVWSVTVESNAATNSTGVARFKFDINADWTNNYGDNDADGDVEKSGKDITFNAGFGLYKIELNASTLKYTVTKLPDGPQAPVADAGADIEIVMGETAFFDASGSTDADNDIVSYAWSNGLTGETASLAYANEGEFVVTLTVTDSEGLSDTDTVTVKVTDGTEPPVSNFAQLNLRGTTNGWGVTAMTLVEDYTWSIDALFNDSNPRFKFDISTNWSNNYGDNNADNIIDKSGNNIAITQGTGTYRITLNDQTKRYTVEKLPEGNQAPIAVASQTQYTINVGDSITFDGSASSDPDGDAITFSWSNGMTGATPTAAFNTAGVFTINMIVTDEEGATDLQPITVTVQALPTTVEVSFTCQNASTTNGTSIYVVGNTPELGNWSVKSSAQKLDPTNYPTWTGTLTLAANTNVSFKCVKANENTLNITQWESGSNNTFNTGANATKNAVGGF